jgi:glycosyltransferase involved in cell wall biosynthesis
MPDSSNLRFVKISIIIPAFNEERLLGESLAKVQSARNAITQHGWESELIVCDNNSQDRTADIARTVGAAVVFESVNQIARARNAGATAATGDWLMFIDADSHPSLELFKDVIAAIESGRWIAGGARIRLEAGYPAGSFVTWMWNCLSRWRGLLAGSFIFCEASAFREIGGFSQELFAAEEIELTQRLRKKARQRGKGIVILQQHPLVTSARKVRLYTAREHFRFLFRVLANHREILRDREACHQWYDGRR